jgi:hypothetical protein
MTDHLGSACPIQAGNAGKSKSPLYARITLLLLLPLLAAVFLGCATIPRDTLSIEPSGVLEADPQVYLRFSGAVLRDIMSTVDEASLAAISSTYTSESKPENRKKAQSPAENRSMELATLESVISRTRSFGAGIRDIGTKAPKTEAVLVGDFKPFSLKIALAFDGNWLRTAEGGYSSIKYPIFVRPPEPGFIHVSTEKSKPSRSSGIKAYPARFASLSQSDIFISANSLIDIFSIPLPLEASSIPVLAMVAAGTQIKSTAAMQSAGSDLRYTLEFHILMKDEASARVFRPVVRFLWVGAANRLFGEGSNAASLTPALEKDEYVIRGIEVTTTELRNLFFRGLSGF